MKNSQSIMTIKVTFVCPDGAQCPSCGLSAKAKSMLRSKDIKVPACDYSRSIVFIDSCLHLPTSLANCVSDLNKVADTTNTSLEQMFPATHAFASQVGYDYLQFSTLTSQKMSFPFSLCTSISSLKEHTSIPDKKFFLDKLSNKTEVDQQSYSTFCKIWASLKFDSLLDCLWIYSLVDSTLLLDCLAYHYVQIWRNTGLFPTFYLTGILVGSCLPSRSLII